MHPADEADPLLQALNDLVALASGDDLDAVDALRTRLREQRLRILVAGEAKRGKSTLVNALLGREILPAGVTPLTALATTVRYGTAEHVTAAFPEGRVDEFPVSALRDLVTERGNPGNTRNLSAVTVSVSAPFWPGASSWLTLQARARFTVTTPRRPRPRCGRWMWRCSC